jgi:hypothetical protein
MELIKWKVKWFKESVCPFYNNMLVCNCVSKWGGKVREQLARKEMKMIGTLWTRGEKVAMQAPCYSAC